jgi:uncharacterized protein (DUF1810 family)
MADEYNLQRFIAAQGDVYEDALGILRRGMMCTPYMDFIFPRLTTEGSGDVNPYSISSLDEARAYLAFPVLGNRYRESVEAISWLADKPVNEVFSDPDTLKLHASLTLFAEATNELILRTVLDLWFDNMVHEETIAQINLNP